MTVPDPLRFGRIQELFHAAAGLPRERRPAFLAAEAPDDPALQAEVLELLQPVAGAMAETAEEEDLPDRIGSYHVLERLGRGGMGVVFLAEQREPVRRLVALKVIRLGLDSKPVLARFQAERQALSLMQHPAIASVFDAGVSTEGQPFIAMEYVRGVPITDYCDQNKLPLRERIELFRRVCAGIQHAHLKGVMHRDLKPANVLVTVQDGHPAPKIIDFGLAKALDHRLVEGTLHTQRGMVLGTPEYMSPEQAGIGGLDVDTRTDVYSLGVMLYELLTGQLPFHREELRTTDYLELQRLLRETDPPKPSTRLTTLGEAAAESANRRGLPLGDLRGSLRGDLDWIVMKAIEKDRTRRYETAAELAADLERHLAHEPVLAGPPTLRYRLGKFLRRHRWQMAAASLLAVTLLAGAVGTAIGFLDARESARVANEKSAEARRLAGELAGKVEDYERLAAHVRAQEALAGAEALHPPWPATAPRMLQWEAEVRALLAQRPAIEHTLQRLQTVAGSAEDDAARFLRSTLLGVLDDFQRLEVLASTIAERRRWALRIDELTANHPRARVTWRDAREAIARSPLYAAHPIDLRQQTGLVPIGENPVTGLWEFYELRSAWDPGAGGTPEQIAIPEHRHDDGTIAMDAGTGIVLVLIPGGTFLMGATDDDPDAQGIERPSTKVTLEPFFLARCELSQGQWLRLGGGPNPSAYAPGFQRPGLPIPPITLAHPVESVSWTAADRLLRQHGLRLPAEAQWELACRAGQLARWWPGDDAAALEGVANVLDQVTLRYAAAWKGAHAPFDDGWLVHAPVGGRRPNPFGLHDVHGNVWEWCSDEFGPLDGPRAREDGGLRQGDGSGKRVVRGGGFMEGPPAARSSSRGYQPPDFTFSTFGVRPGRDLQR